MSTSAGMQLMKSSDETREIEFEVDGKAIAYYQLKASIRADIGDMYHDFIRASDITTTRGRGRNGKINVDFQISTAWKICETGRIRETCAVQTVPGFFLGLHAKAGKDAVSCVESTSGLKSLHST